ncbi:MAG: thioredoxin domain-containing protein [Thermodesulfobacteriota bacterium]
MFSHLDSQKSSNTHRGWACVFSMLLGLVLLQASAALADPSPRLDEAAFRRHAAERIRILKGNKDPRFLQATEKHVTIEKTSTIDLPTGTLYGVRFRVATPTAEKESEVVTLIVDPSGTFIYPDVQELSTGKSLVRDALSELRTIEHIDPAYGKEIYRGTGTHDVILISDPFCPHCRKGWGWLMENKGKLRSLRTAHFPLSPASEAACMALNDLKHLGVKPMEAEDYAYTFLNPSHDPKEVIQQFLEGFAEFKKANGEDAEAVLKKLEGKYQEAVRKERADAQAIGISSTPAFFIDGKMVDGFNAAKIEELLK